MHDSEPSNQLYEEPARQNINEVRILVLVVKLKNQTPQSTRHREAETCTDLTSESVRYDQVHAFYPLRQLMYLLCAHKLVFE